jgi:hypothetical protein
MRMLLILLAACASTGVAPTADDRIPTCSSLAECKAHDGERVHVVAVYSVWDPLPYRPDGLPPPRQVMLRFGDQDGPFLGAWGRDGHLRSLDEIARFRGKRVRVTGRFLSVMPPHPTDPPHAASLGGACVYPVDTIARE